ncbi:hypothetical protein HWV62_25246 [Athelia sp. TMB]|nr:hypothetical protein HWV62_25246 [Athelia sp. TMB]
MVTQLPRTRVIVIGAGFSGLAMGAQLNKQLGLEDYVIYERSPDYGGTWWANRYPGCGVDIPSIFYSLSFAPNPDFSKMFPDQHEILAYIKGVAHKFGVDRHIQLNTSWDGAVWQEESKTWSVSLSSVLTGETFVQECDIFVTAIGGLVNPNPCTIPGFDAFPGPKMHTARWDPRVSLADKNVVVIGNGCSGSQLVPAIAPQCKNVFQFFRSSQFYFPRTNPAIHPAVKWAFRWVPGLMLCVRWLLFHLLEYTFIQFQTTPRGDRQRAYTKKMSDAYVEKTAPREYWDMLKPKYKVGCKRRVFDPGYLACLHRENVHLTNDPIVKIEENEVITDSGKRYPADVIVLANGFVTEDLNLSVVGVNGATPKQHWAEYGGIEAYKTTALSSFPNFFIIFGPNAASGHTSVIFSIETVIDLVIKLVRPVLNGKAATVSVKPEYEKAYSKAMQEGLSNRVWADCKWWQARFPDMKAWSYSSLKTE